MEVRADENEGSIRSMFTLGRTIQQVRTEEDVTVGKRRRQADDCYLCRQSYKAHRNEIFS
jgi:hypothetical protein